MKNSKTKTKTKTKSKILPPVKPKRRIRLPIYYYTECMEYLEKKYNFDSRDYAGKFSPKNIRNDRYDTIPYLDFWHWILNVYGGVSGGATLVFDNDLLDAATEEWQKKILGYILAEFGEGKNRRCEFLVE